MKLLPFYQDFLKCNTSDQVFSHLVKNLKEKITIWSYFVNWEKVFKNTDSLEVELNILNTLLGKSNFENEFKALIRKYPETLKAIPSLIVRDGESSTSHKILVDFSNKRLQYESYNFFTKNVSLEEADRFFEFVEKTGLRKLFVERAIKNLVDYLTGVEAGLDSNGRKNRGGDAMEQIVEAFIQDYSKKHGFRYLKEANAVKIKSEFGYTVPVDKSIRRYDFVVNTGKELLIFETNFYGGGGSKLKSTANEYRVLNGLLKNKFKFIWITDGRGWLSTLKPLRESFNEIDYIFTLNLLENDILDHLDLR